MLNYPSVLVPLGDFFCLGHGMVNSFQSALFSASTLFPYQFNKPCALNCYAPMPFAKARRGGAGQRKRRAPPPVFLRGLRDAWRHSRPDTGYFHAEFRRANPFGGWGPEIRVNTPEADVVNMERQAWENNYVILETKGRGHYIGCNLSVTNFTRDWWGEGDDMIWVDGYKWPPDLHGTGSEDYFNQAWGMQPNAFLRNGSSIFEGGTIPAPEIELWRGDSGYQTSYVFHLENPVRFTARDQGHHRARSRQPPGQRDEQRGLLVRRTASPGRGRAAGGTAPASAARQPGELDKSSRTAVSRQPVSLTIEMQTMKAKWAKKVGG